MQRYIDRNAITVTTTSSNVGEIQELLDLKTLMRNLLAEGESLKLIGISLGLEVFCRDAPVDAIPIVVVAEEGGTIGTTESTSKLTGYYLDASLSVDYKYLLLPTLHTLCEKDIYVDVTGGGGTDRKSVV